MRNRTDDLGAIRAIDDLASVAPKRMFALSPNDVLVQVSLPLVLILAILTRLMIIGQALTLQDRGPVILEMWKQQLILRMDRVLVEWETQAGLPAFPEFSRIQWRDALPDDARFQTLCSAALDIDNPDDLRLDLYHRALAGSSGADFDGANALDIYLLDLYDPQAPFHPEYPERIPPEFVITPERRAYALDYIGDRILQWARQVEDLQWSVVAQCAAHLPFRDDADSVQMADQMRRLADVLETHGYPLLRAVKDEFETTP